MQTHLLVAVLGAAAVQPLNWAVGWGLVLAAFVSGAALGLGWHREAFLGGYASFRRRVVRLGHIAFAALGLMNVIFALSPLPEPGTIAARAASIGFIAGGVLMPTVCFLTGWRAGCRHLFAIPVLSLMVAVIFTLWGGLATHAIPAATQPTPATVTTQPGAP